MRPVSGCGGGERGAFPPFLVHLWREGTAGASASYFLVCHGPPLCCGHQRGLRGSHVQRATGHGRQNQNSIPAYILISSSRGVF